MENERSRPPPRAASSSVPGRSPTAAATSPSSPFSPSLSRELAWEARLSEVASYRASHSGRDPTRSAGGGEFRSLCDWLNRQRGQYARYERGERCALDDDRVRMLENGLGADWWTSSSRRPTKGGGVVGAAMGGRGGRGMAGGGGGRGIKNDGIVRSPRRTPSRAGGSILSDRLWRSSSEEESNEEGGDEDLMESLYDERADEEDGGADEELGTVDSYSDDENDDDDDDDGGGGGGGGSDDREEDEEEEAEEEEEEERGGKWTGGGGDYFDVGIGLPLFSLGGV